MTPSVSRLNTCILSSGDMMILTDVTRPSEVLECHNELIDHTCSREWKHAHVRSEFDEMTDDDGVLFGQLSGTRTGIGRHEEEGND